MLPFKNAQLGIFDLFTFYAGYFYLTGLEIEPLAITAFLMYNIYTSLSFTTKDSSSHGRR